MPKQFYRNSSRKPLLFENTKMLIAFEEKNRCVIYYNFRRTFVPNSRRHCRWRRRPHTVRAMWGAAMAARTHARISRYNKAAVALPGANRPADRPA